MEYGLIKDTTMTAIGDSLRDKGFIPATRLEDVQRESFHYATENVTSDTDATPAYNANSDLPELGTLGYSPIITEMPGASSIELVVDIGLVHPDDYTSTQCGHFEIYDRNDTQILSETINKDYKGKHTYIVPGDYVRYGRNSSYVTIKNCYTAFIVDLYPLDADGNRISYLSQEQVPNTITPSEMAEALTNVPALPPESALLLKGNVMRMNWGGYWDWFFENCGELITTEDITNLGYFMTESKIAQIPFVINIKNCTNCSPAFQNMINLQESPKIRGTFDANALLDFSSVISTCERVRDFSELFEPDMLNPFANYKCTSSFSTAKPPNLSGCKSLRTIPEWFYKFRLCEESTAWPYVSYILYYNCFTGCYALDEAKNLPVWRCTVGQTSNMFSSTFSGCRRLKSITFETNDGQPIVTQWKSQLIDLSSTIGYASSSQDICNYNSGITKDKEVINDVQYQALKDDPDWFSYIADYSRYNHDSAVETINSLPDTSAYLATAGGTNTIKFRKNSGLKTDGGAIENLTAEEIAVAAAKGWTVSLV